MIDQQMIENPPHYVEGRKIQPIEAIEEWSLCHHLGCVVKYIARIGRKPFGYQGLLSGQSSLGDLRKAEWYLMREIHGQACEVIYKFTHSPGRALALFSPESIAKDWQLTPSLDQVIYHITSHQRLFYRLSFIRLEHLKQALTHLKTEIKNREKQELAAYTTLLRDQASGKTNIINFTGGKPCKNYPK
jgi:hypothetical protein